MESTNIQDVLEPCRERQARLRTAADDLARDLHDAAASLSRTGIPVPPATLDRLKRFRTEFDDVCAQLSRVSPVAPLPTLTVIERELDTLELIRRALERLELVPRIQHREQSRFLAWDRCLAELARWKDQLTSSDRDLARRSAEEFLAPEAGLNAVVTLVADGESLTDDQWSTLLDAVAGVYGREISTAIARGKLFLVPGSRA